MATLYATAAGYELQTKSPSGVRKTVRLGDVTKRVALEIKRRVEQVLSSTNAHVPFDHDLSQWLGGIGDELSERLSRAGIIEPRQRAVRMTVGECVDSFLASRAAAKPNSLKNYRQACRVLTAYIDRATPLASVGTAEAKEVAARVYADYAEASASRLVKFFRQVWADAVESRAAKENVFRSAPVKSMHNPERLRFITRDDIDRVLRSCPDDEWRLIVTLARYGGLRIPSELYPMRWGHIDWPRGRFAVHAPKTGTRVVPLFPEVRASLTAHAAGTVPEPDDPVIRRKGKTAANLHITLAKIIVQAGVTPWPRIFQNLRASRETELTATFPLHVVAQWIGNSPAVAAKHYLSITEMDFDRASGPAGQNPRQYPAVPGRTEPETKANQPGNYGLVRVDTCTYGNEQYTPQAIPESTICLEITGVLGNDTAKSEAFPDPALAAVIAAWPRLTAGQRAEIGQIVRQ